MEGRSQLCSSFRCQESYAYCCCRCSIRRRSKSFRRPKLFIILNLHSLRFSMYPIQILLPAYNSMIAFGPNGIKTALRTSQNILPQQVLDICQSEWYITKHYCMHCCCTSLLMVVSLCSMAHKVLHPQNGRRSGPLGTGTTLPAPF